MNQKLKLKSWVKVALLLLPQIIIIVELFFVGIKLDRIGNQPITIIQENTRCAYGE